MIAARKTSNSRHRDDVRAIKRLAAAWRTGWLTGDADALVSLYAPRPILMPQGQPAIRGKAKIRALYRALLRAVTIRSKGKLVEVRSAGDWGYFWSTYALTGAPKHGGERFTSRGKSLFIVRRNSHGVWQIARLIDNSDLPGDG